MNKICKTVISQKGKVKLNVHSFLLVKECSVENTYYWSCEKKRSENCSDCAVTIFSNETHDLLAQIIQNNIASVDENLVSNMPSNDALHIRIKHIRSSEMPPQSQTLDEVNVPLLFQYTLKEELFLIRDSQVGLGQLYTIHAPVGLSENSQIFSLIYALMSTKSEELYMQLFQDLNNFVTENEFILRMLKIITNFEIAAINAS
ncbi:19245_t:CDS:2, partial [Cetraspora pellucida]